MRTHILLTTFIIQQQPALINIQIAKFKKFKENDDPIKASPPISSIAMSMLCVEYLCVSTLINDPPTRYPNALIKKM